MKYLVGTTETYRVDTEEEVTELRESAMTNTHYDLVGFSYRPKVKKQKGEVIEDWYEVTVRTSITDEAEPDRRLRVRYEADV